MPKILREKLKNGLVVLAEKKPNAEDMVAIKIGIKIGSAHEDKKEQGIVHLIEHMAFKSQGRRHFEEVNKMFEHNGIRFYAGTCRNVLLFEAKAPREHQALAICELYRSVKNMKYDFNELKREKESVLGEILRLKDDPEEYSADKFFSVVLRESSFERPILGTARSIKRISRHQLIQFKKSYFRPNNMFISICGMYDEVELLRILRGTFGRLKFKNLLPLEVKEPVFKNQNHLSVIKKRKGISSIYLYLGYLIPGFNHSDSPKLQLLNSFLADGNSSRLYTEMVLKRGLGYDLAGNLVNYGNFSVFYFYVQIAKPGRFIEARKKLFEEIKKTGNVAVEDLEGYKNWMISRLKERLADIEERAWDMLLNEIEGWVYDFRKLPVIISRVTPEEIQKTAKKYLTDNYTLFAVVPWGFKIRKYHLKKN